MPKTLNEIRQFIRGTVTHPSGSDIDVDAASKSLNIDPNSRDGLLSGINEDRVDIELLSNQNANFVDVFAQPAISDISSLFISNVFCVDISSVVIGKKDYLIRGYETNTGTTDISLKDDTLKGNVIFIVSNAKLPWLTASNSENGLANLYNHFIGISSHLDSSPGPAATEGGGIDVNWLKGIWEAKYPEEWTHGQTNPASANFGFKGNYMQFADEDGWLTGSIIKYGGDHVVDDEGTGSGLPSGTYYAMPIMLINSDGTPKPTASWSVGDKAFYGINCYQGYSSYTLSNEGAPRDGWGANQVHGSEMNCFNPGGQVYGFGVYQPYISTNDWSGLSSVDYIRDKDGSDNRVFLDTLNNQIHYQTGLSGTSYEDSYGLGGLYPTTAKILTFNLPETTSTISSTASVNNNKELHVGTGNDATNETLWTGYVVLPQFGNEIEDPIVEKARLAGADSVPAMHKIVEDDEYVYGIAWYGSGDDAGGTPSINRGTATDNTRVYKFRKYEGPYGTTGHTGEDLFKGYLELESLSVSVFKRLTAIALAYPAKGNKNTYRKCLYREGTDSHLWLYDSDQGERGTMYLIDRATMAVHKEFPIMEEFDFYDNDKDYFTDLHEVFLGNHFDRAYYGTHGLGDTEVSFETALHASVPCVSRGYDVGSKYDRETTVAQQGDGSSVVAYNATTIRLSNITGISPTGVVVIGDEYISYASVNAVDKDLVGCTRALNITDVGGSYDLDHPLRYDAVHTEGTKHYEGERVFQENWNEYPDLKYCFIMIPRDQSDLTTENIQLCTDRTLLRKGDDTNWENKQHLRPMSISLINVGNGKYWPTAYNPGAYEKATGAAADSGGIRYISNCKGFQPTTEIGNIMRLGSHIDQITDEDTQSPTDHTQSFHGNIQDVWGATIAGLDTADERATGFKSTGQWATYDAAVNDDTVCTVKYVGTDTIFSAADLTIQEVGTGFTRRDFDLLITVGDHSADMDGYEIKAATYTQVFNHNGYGVHPTDPTLWPKQQREPLQHMWTTANGSGHTATAPTEDLAIISESPELFSQDQWGKKIVNSSTWHYLGNKPGVIPNVAPKATIYGVPESWSYPNIRSTATDAEAWEGIKFKFSAANFSTANGTMEFFVSVRCAENGISYLPSHVKLSVPRLPFGGVAGNSQAPWIPFNTKTYNSTTGAEQAPDYANYPVGASNQKEDFTFNMIVEPGELAGGGASVTGMIVPGHNPVTGKTDNRVAALAGKNFYELPATGTWTTLYQAASTTYANTHWSSVFMNDSRMHCSKYFNPMTIGYHSGSYQWQPNANHYDTLAASDSARRSAIQTPWLAYAPGALVNFGTDVALGFYNPNEVTGVNGLKTTEALVNRGRYGNAKAAVVRPVLKTVNSAFTMQKWVNVAEFQGNLYTGGKEGNDYSFHPNAFGYQSTGIMGLKAIDPIGTHECVKFDNVGSYTDIIHMPCGGASPTRPIHVQGETAHSASMWIAVDKDADYPMSLYACKGDPTQPLILQWVIHENSMYLKWQITGAASYLNGTSAAITNLNNAPGIGDGNWHHVGFSLSASNATFFMDGVKLSPEINSGAAFTVSGFVDDTFGNMYIGGQMDSSPTDYTINHFSGMMAHFCTYNGEIADNNFVDGPMWNNGMPPNYANLEAYTSQTDLGKLTCWLPLSQRSDSINSIRWGSPYGYDSAGGNVGNRGSGAHYFDRLGWNDAQNSPAILEPHWAVAKNHSIPQPYQHGPGNTSPLGISSLNSSDHLFTLAAGLWNRTGNGAETYDYSYIQRLYTQFKADDGKFEMIDWFDEDSECFLPRLSVSTSYPQTSNLVHIVYVKESGNKVHNLYINGKKFTHTATKDMAAFESDPKFCMGGMNNTWSGLTTDCEDAFWAAALSDANVTELYNDGYTTNPLLASFGTANLKGYWRGDNFPFSSLLYTGRYNRLADKDRSGKGFDMTGGWRNAPGSAVDNFNQKANRGGVDPSGCASMEGPITTIGSRGKKSFGTLAGECSPVTENNIYFWEEDMMGGLENTPTTLASKLKNPPICFTYTTTLSGENQSALVPRGTLGMEGMPSFDQGDLILSGLNPAYGITTNDPTTEWNRKIGTKMPRGGMVSNGTTVFYLGDGGIVEAKLNITGNNTLPYSQKSGGFKGAWHPDLSCPFHTDIDQLTQEPYLQIKNYYNVYRAYSWPIIYNKGTAEAKMWHGSSIYTHPSTSILTDTNLTLVEADRPFTNNLHVNISRKNEGPVDPDTIEANRIKKSTDYIPDNDDIIKLNEMFDAGATTVSAYGITDQGGGGSGWVSDHASLQQSIKSFSTWIKPLWCGGGWGGNFTLAKEHGHNNFNENHGTIASKTNAISDYDEVGAAKLLGSYYDETCLFFDKTADSMLLVPPSNLLLPDKQFTVSFWVKREDTCDGSIIAAMPRVLDTTLPLDTRWAAWSLSVSLSRIHIYMVSNGNDYGTTSAITLPSGTWKHVCLTYDGTLSNGTLSLYIDGVADVTTYHLNPGVIDYGGLAGSLMIGSATPYVNAGTSFDGYIDEFGMWDVVLEPETIASIHAHGRVEWHKNGDYGTMDRGIVWEEAYEHDIIGAPTNHCMDLILYLPMHEGTGKTVHDVRTRNDSGQLMMSLDDVAYKDNISYTGEWADKPWIWGGGVNAEFCPGREPIWHNNVYDRGIEEGWRFAFGPDPTWRDPNDVYENNQYLWFIYAFATTNLIIRSDTKILPLKKWSRVGFTMDSATNPTQGTIKIYLNGTSIPVSIIQAGTGAAVPDNTTVNRSKEFGLGCIGVPNDANNYKVNTSPQALFKEPIVWSDEKSGTQMLSVQASEAHDLINDADAIGGLLEYWNVDSSILYGITNPPYTTTYFTSGRLNSIDLTRVQRDTSTVDEWIGAVADYPMQISQHNVFDSTGTIIDPAGWDGKGFMDFTMMTNNSILPAKGENTIGIGVGLSLKSWHQSFTSDINTNSHGLILIPSFFGFVYPTETGSGYTSDLCQFWKVAFIYDGIQEGELSTRFIPDWDGDSVKHRTVKFYLNEAVLSKRVSHVMFFRASSADPIATEPDSFYRLVKNIRLDTGVQAVTDPALGTLRIVEFVDTGTLTSTYDAITGLSETVIRTIPNYKLSTSANGSLFVANCYHEEAGGKLHEYMFKSKPYKYDQFDWTLDYITLSDIPTALEAFNGKIYAFTSYSTMRINPTSLYIEDEFSGAGCLNDQSIIATDFGLFYFDSNNIYVQRGGTPEPIGHPILTSSDGIGFQDIMRSYDESVFKARALFNSEKNAVMCIVSATRAWVYSIERERWDFWEIPDNSNIFYDEGGDPWYVSKGLDRGTFSNTFLVNNATGAVGSNMRIGLPALYHYAGNRDKFRGFEWNSKNLDMDIGTQEKYFYQIDTMYSGTEPAVTYGTNGSAPLEEGVETIETAGHKKVKIDRSNKKKKSLKVKVSVPATAATEASAVTLKSSGLLSNYNGTTYTVHTPGSGIGPFETIDLDGTGGTGAKVRLNTSDFSSTTGNITYTGGMLLNHSINLTNSNGQYVEWTDNTTFDGATVWTLNQWYASTHSGDSGNNAMLTKGGWHGNATAFTTLMDFGQQGWPKFSKGSGTGDGYDHTEFGSGNPMIEADSLPYTWYMYTIVFDGPGTNFDAYINGVKATSTSYPSGGSDPWTAIYNGSDPIRLGANVNLHAATMAQMAFSNIAFWDVKLTDADVLKLYNGGVPTDLSDNSSYDTGTPASNLIHWWKLDEGSGTVINDSGSATQTGTILGSSLDNVWGNSDIAPPGADAIITTVNDHGFGVGDVIFFDSATPGDRAYAGVAKILTVPTTKTFTCPKFWSANAPATKTMIVQRLTAATLDAKGTKYTTSSHLPDNHTGTKSRLLVVPDGTMLGNNARIILEIDAISETASASTDIDSIGMVYRRSSKVRM